MKDRIACWRPCHNVFGPNATIDSGFSDRKNQFMLFDVIGASSWLNELTRLLIIVHPLLSGSDMSIQSSNRRSILIFIFAGLFFAVAVKMVTGDLISNICQSLYCKVRVIFELTKRVQKGLRTPTPTCLLLLILRVHRDQHYFPTQQTVLVRDCSKI